MQVETSKAIYFCRSYKRQGIERQIERGRERERERERNKRRKSEATSKYGYVLLLLLRVRIPFLDAREDG